jgi:hypothetical protein
MAGTKIQNVEIRKWREKEKDNTLLVKGVVGEMEQKATDKEFRFNLEKAKFEKDLKDQNGKPVKAGTIYPFAHEETYEIKIDGKETESHRPVYFQGVGKDKAVSFLKKR